jgi:hypothetical protein
MRSATIRSHVVEIVADTIQSGDIAFMIICTALVFLMIPGVGYVCVSTSIKHSMLMITADSSTLVWPDASRLSRSSGFLSWLPLLSLSSGSSGVTRLLSPTMLASSSVLLTTSASRMSLLNPRSEAPEFLISCMRGTRECSLPSRKFPVAIKSA